MTAPDLSKWRHDLKNQLGIVVGFSELLMSEMEESDPRRADVAEIHTAAQRALDLVAHVPGEPGQPGDDEESGDQA